MLWLVATLVGKDCELKELVLWLVATLVKGDSVSDTAVLSPAIAVAVEDRLLIGGLGEGVKGASRPFGLASKYPGHV